MSIQEYLNAEKLYIAETRRLYPDGKAIRVRVGETVSTIHGEGVVVSLEEIFGQPRPAVKHFTPPLAFDGTRLTVEHPAYMYPEFRPIEQPESTEDTCTS